MIAYIDEDGREWTEEELDYAEYLAELARDNAQEDD